MKKAVTTLFVFVGVLASTVSASAMAFNTTITGPVNEVGQLFSFGSAQKVESHLNVVTYWKASSAGQSFTMRLCARDASTGKVKNSTGLNYLSPGWMTLNPERYQLELWGGAVPGSFAGAFKKTTVSGTWELPMTMREKTDTSEKIVE